MHMAQMVKYTDRLIRKAESFSGSFLHLRACPHGEAVLQHSDFLTSGSFGPEAWFFVEELSKNVTLKIPKIRIHLQRDLPRWQAVWPEVLT